MLNELGVLIKEQLERLGVRVYETDIEEESDTKSKKEYDVETENEYDTNTLNS